MQKDKKTKKTKRQKGKKTKILIDKKTKKDNNNKKDPTPSAGSRTRGPVAPKVLVLA